MTEDVKGYKDDERNNLLSSLHGKTLKELKETMGKPAAEGICSGCDRGADRVELVYLNETIPRYSFALTMANQSEIGCFIIYLSKDDAGDFRYEGYTMDQASCAAKSVGAIDRIRKYSSN